MCVCGAAVSIPLLFFPTFSHMRLILHINGLKCEEDWGDTAVPLVITNVPDNILQSGCHYGPTTELVFTLHAQITSDDPRELEGFGVCGYFPGTRGPHYLGPINKISESSLFVATNAISANPVIKLERQYFSERCSSAPTVAEWLLAQHIRVIIANDECMGSMTVNVVQNRVIRLPFYSSAMIHHGKTSPFTKFLQRFDCIHGFWRIFRYQDDEKMRFPTSSFDLGGMRITTVELYETNSYLVNDLARERLHFRARIEIQEVLALLRGSDTPSPMIVQTLGESRSFKTLREIEITRMMKSYATLVDRGVVHHPMHAVMMIRGVSTDDRFAQF